MSTKDIFLFCDTCMFVRDFDFRNSFWTKVKALLTTRKNTLLLVTSPLKTEIEKKLSEIVAKDLADLEKAKLKLRLRASSEVLDLDVVRENQKSFSREYFTSALKKEFDGRIHVLESFPKITVQDAFQSAAAVSKPFSHEDRPGGYRKAANGFRDFVIWHSVEEFAAKKKGAVILFCTDNTKDFADDSGELHPDLKERLKSVGFPLENFVFVTKDQQLEPFLKKPPFSAEMKGAFQQLANEVIEFEQKDIASAISSTVNFYNILPSGSHPPFDILDCEKVELVADQAYEDKDNLYLVEGTVSFTYRIEFFSDKYNWPEEPEPGKAAFEIVDDWNDYHNLALTEEQNIDLPFLSTALVENGSIKEIKDFMVSGIEFPVTEI